MSTVAVVEALAWLISIALAGWMLLDMTRVARRHSESSLIDTADPLDDAPDALDDVALDDVAGSAATRTDGAGRSA